MEVNIYRRKLLNAVLFFAKNTKHSNLTKLSKLLYFLDFTHFRQTGYPCIGLNYFAFEKGPVPKDFWLEVREGDVPEDFRDKLALITRVDEIDPSRREIVFRAKADADLSIFTPREIEILKNLAFIFEEARARDISEVSHLPKEPWDTTMKRRGENSPIDYLLAIDEDSEVSSEEAEESLKEHFEAMHNFHLDPTR